jgi:carboxyl-terminal processing protease
MRKLIYSMVLLFAVFVTACKKDKKVEENTGDPTEPTKVGSTLDLIRDSVYLYANEEYYWHDALPGYAEFKPRSFEGSSDIAALQSEVDAISQFKINPLTGKPYEYSTSDPGTSKYSFIDNGEVSGELGGINGDFGFAPFYNDYSDLRIKYVYAGSPAGKAGIKRGDQIVGINGRTGVDLKYDGDGGSGQNLNFVIDAYANSSTIKLTLKRGNKTFDASLNVSEYTINPVMATKVIDAGSGHKIGYIVFSSFTSMDNAKAKLDAAFSTFSSSNVTDLVVDLRYNGGGYVATSEYLSDLIVPSSKNGSLMYTTYYTDNLQNDKHPLLDKIYNIGADDFKPENNKVNFSKAGGVNAKRVFFIVTGNTASASELTINNLIPVMDVKLIGMQTYGKPVGFFGLDINKYQLYIPEFETKNSLDKGGYYTGMLPSTTAYPGVEDYDDVTKDFGDPTEGLLAHAISYVKTGTFSVNKTRIQSLSGAQTMSIEQARHAGIQLDANKFNGMIKVKNLKKK